MCKFNLFLEKIKNQPALFLGNKDVVALSYVISGYEEAIYDLTGNRVLFNTKFQIIIEKKHDSERFMTIHWSQLLVNIYSEESFDRFFELWSEFLRVYPDWENLDICLF